MTNQPPHDQTRDQIADLTSAVTFRMARAQNKLNAQMTHLLRQHSDLTLVEWRVLRMLGANGPSTMADLTRQVQMDKGQLSRKCSAMIDRGMIAGAPDDLDHRKLILSLTPKGEAALDRLMPMVKRRLQSLVSDVPEDDLAVFFDVLEKIGAAAETRTL